MEEGDVGVRGPRLHSGAASRLKAESPARRIVADIVSLRREPPCGCRKGERSFDYRVSVQQLSKKGTVAMSGTVRLPRVLRATPERIYRAFLDADAMAKWL